MVYLLYMVIVHGYVSHNQMVAIENGTFIVGSPIQKNDVPSLFVCLAEGKHTPILTIIPVRFRQIAKKNIPIYPWSMSHDITILASFFLVTSPFSLLFPSRSLKLSYCHLVI